MVRIEDMDNTLEDFFKDSDRHKGRNKLLMDFDTEEFKIQSREFVVEKPKFKKGEKASKFIKPDANKKSLF